MTPVTGGVADGQEDELVALPGSREGLLPPRVPVDRVASMLPQVRRALVS